MKKMMHKYPALPLKIKRHASQIFAGEGIGFSGPEITGYFSQYSDDIVDYWDMDVKSSRWVLFEEFLRYFPIIKQKQLLLELCDYDGPMKYRRPSRKDVGKLKKWLAEGTPASKEIDEALKNVNCASINTYWKKALERLNDDPEGAITSARAMIESTCKAILEEKKTAYKEDGDLIKLYKQAAKELNLAPEQHAEQAFKQVLGGCSSVVTGVASLRNVYGDAHGKGKKHKKPSLRHARLAANMAGGLCLFLLETLTES